MERGRGATWINRVMAGLLGLFVIATLGRALVGGVTLLDVNVLTRFAPWSSLHGSDILNTVFCRGDTVDSVMPSMAEVRSRLLHGDFPGWSASAVGGFPLAGVPNFGQFSLLSLPYYVLPLWLAPAFVIFGVFAVGIAGMTLFLRRLGLSFASGVLAGIVFVTSGFMISWTNWPQVRVAAFIPALFWAVERLVQRRRVVDVLPLAVVVASMALGGFPAVTGMALYCAGSYFLVRVVMVYRSRWKNSLRAAVLAVLGLALGAGLSAFQLLPFSKQLSSMDLAYRAQTPLDHSPPSSLLTTLVPNAQGLCINGVSYSPVNPIENVAFIGVAAMVLGVVAIMMRTRMVQPGQRGVVGFLGSALVLVVTLGWLGGPALALAQGLPVFSTNDVGRIRSLLGFLLAALAGFGFEWLLSVVRDRDDHSDDPQPRGGSRHHDRAGEPDEATQTVDEPAPPPGRSRTGSAGSRLRSSVVLLATTFFALWVIFQAVSEARARGTIGYLASASVVPAILLIASVAAVFAVTTGRRWAGRAAIVAIAVMVVGQSTAAFKGSVTDNKPVNFYPVTSTHQYLQWNLGSDRFASSGRTMYPATSAYYGLRTPTGHQFTTDAWKSLLLAVDSRAMWTPTFSWFTPGVVNAKTVGDIPLLDQMAVRYFVTPPFDIAGRSVHRPSTSKEVTLLASDQHAKCLPMNGPLRAVVVNVAKPLRGTPRAGFTVHVVLHTSRGDLTGARYYGPDRKTVNGLRIMKTIPVAVPGEDLTAADPVTADVWVTGLKGTIALRGRRAAVSCGKVVPIRDGLKLVSSAGGAIIYQRLTSQPRIRWASKMTVLKDPAARVARLKAGIGPDAVVLHDPAPPASGKPAKVRVTSDGGDTIAVNVDAAGSGYLLVADSLQQPGWAATVDGEPVELLPANNAMVVVPVSAGVHRVELGYTVPGQRVGVLVTGGAFLVFLGILAMWWRRRPDRGVPPRSVVAPIGQDDSLYRHEGQASR